MKSQGTGEYELGQSEQKGICLVWAKTDILLKKNCTMAHKKGICNPLQCITAVQFDTYYPLEMGFLWKKKWNKRSKGQVIKTKVQQEEHEGSCLTSVATCSSAHTYVVSESWLSIFNLFIVQLFIRSTYQIPNFLVKFPFQIYCPPSDGMRRGW